jgi:phenylacetate-CoA ligase
MNKHFLKRIKDKIPEPLKYFTASLFRNEIIKSKEFRKYYNLLTNRETLSPEIIEEYQFDQLKSILVYSNIYVPYYQELFKKISFNPDKFSDFKQIEKIPFLTREIIQANFNKLISRKKVNGGYYVGNTGGSSGLPLKFLLDYNSVHKECAFIYYYRQKLRYTFEDKLITFRDIEFENKFWKYNPMHNELIFSPRKLSKITINSFANQFDKAKPQYLNGYLSTIWYFAKLLDEYQIKLNNKLKGIFLISENIDPKQRKFIEKFFNVLSTSFYGHSERCVIAEEVSQNMYKFDPYYGFTEEIPIENNQYSIVGTGFLNKKMPFIRYKTDDTCSLKNQLYIIDGKRSSNIGLYGHNNEFLSSTAFDLQNPVFKNITTYQFIQKVKGKAELLIIVNKNFQNSELAIIKDEILHQTKGIIDIEIRIVESLILSPRGKYQMYISNLNLEE